MLSKQTVLPNFIRAILVVAIASFSFNANAGHHEKDMKKAKSEHMEKSADMMDGHKDKMKGHKMKGEMGDKYKKDMKKGEEAMEDAAEEAAPE